MNASFDDARRFLALLAQPGDVFELRALTKGRSSPIVTAGYFDDMTKLAAAAVERSGKDDGVYITLNPVNPALLARAPANRVRQAGNGDTTSDRDVHARRHLLVDVDPVRPTGISSTDAEHAASLDLAGRIADDLAALGWPEPIRADSGNGGHLIYAIDLPVADGDLVKRVLAELSRRYTTPEHKVDEKVFNPARISKMYGTLTRKGENTVDRPHRLARIVRAPETLRIVTREQLEALLPRANGAGAANGHGANGSATKRDRYEPRPGQPSFDLDAWIAEHVPDAIAQPWSEGRKWLLPVCPFNDSHNRREAFIVEKHGGMIAAACQHESCFKSWRDLRLRFEPDAYRRLAEGTMPGTARLSDREPPPEVLYEDERYAAELEAFADRDREPPVTAPATPVVRLITISEALDDLASFAKMPVFETPFPTLNQTIGFGGLIGSQVYTVAAGTGRGKTSWVAGLATYVAERHPVIVATYEMKPGYFIARTAAGRLSTHSNAILRGAFDMQRVKDVMPYPDLFLMRKPSLRELRTGVEEITRRYGRPPLLVVDYLQKLADEIAAKQAKPDLRMATSEASATLLDIGETTGAGIVAVSSIGRGKGKVTGTPRKLDPYDLVEVAKESGAVEYDGAAMIVLSLSRDHEHSEQWGEERIGTMTLAKARFGQECHIDARYNGARGWWRDVGRAAERSATNAELDAIAAKTTTIRDAILNALRVHGPQPSKKKLAEKTQKNRDAVNKEVDVMVGLKILVKDSKEIRIATARDAASEDADPLIPGLIRAAEGDGDV